MSHFLARSTGVSVIGAGAAADQEFKKMSLSLFLREGHPLVTDDSNSDDMDLLVGRGPHLASFLNVQSLLTSSK